MFANDKLPFSPLNTKLEQYSQQLNLCKAISYFKNRIRHVSTSIVLLSRNERESDLRGSYVVVVIVVVTGLRPQEPRIVDEE